MSENRVEQVELLSSDNDSYGGVVVKIEQPIDSKIFPSLLRASISQWRQQVYIYIYVSIVSFNLISLSSCAWYPLDVELCYKLEM